MKYKKKNASGGIHGLRLFAQYSAVRTADCTLQLLVCDSRRKGESCSVLFLTAYDYSSPDSTLTAWQSLVHLILTVSSSWAIITPIVQMRKLRLRKPEGWELQVLVTWLISGRSWAWIQPHPCLSPDSHHTPDCLCGHGKNQTTPSPLLQHTYYFPKEYFFLFNGYWERGKKWLVDLQNDLRTHKPIFKSMLNFEPLQGWHGQFHHAQSLVDAAL